MGLGLGLGLGSGLGLALALGIEAAPVISTHLEVALTLVALVLAAQPRLAMLGLRVRAKVQP